MKNHDEQCFKWAVTKALNPVAKDPQRVTKILQKQSERLDWEGPEFPTPCSERMFKKFERNNDVSLLVFGHSDKNIIPLYVSTERREKVARLFFVRQGGQTHYCVINDMSALVGSQTSAKKNKKYVCDYCLNHFGSQDLLDSHTEYCSKHNAVNTIFPEPGKNILKFKNIQNQVECPIKIYADFESFLTPIDKMSGKTKLYQQHVPSAFCMYVVSRVEGFSMDPITYVRQGDEHVDKVFVDKLEDLTKNIYERFKVSVPMVFDETARELHESQDECYACKTPFNGDKVRDHCHYTGKYRGALHSKCNLRLRRSRTIPVFFHNLTGYDCHLFVKRLADSPGDVNCIPRNEEKYVTFNKSVLVDTVVREDKEVKIYSTLKFVDTMNFMQTSLEKLVKNLDASQFKHTGKYFQGEKLDLMLRKGVYPYEHMTDTSKFRETKLPLKKAFKSYLGSGTVEGEIQPSEISDQDYQQAQVVFKTFGCKNLADCTELYCKSDVLLLADVFESFIDVCLEKYKLILRITLQHRR